MANQLETEKNSLEHAIVSVNIALRHRCINILLCLHPTRDCSVTRIASARRSWGVWFDFRPNHVIAKDVKNCTWWCVRCATLLLWEGGNTLVQNRRNKLPCSDKTSRQRFCNKRVFLKKLYWSRSLDLLNSLALGCYYPSPASDLLLPP